MNRYFEKRSIRAAEDVEIFLKSNYPDVRDKIAEHYRRQWEVDLDIGDKKESVTVSLPHEFPNLPPIIKVKHVQEYWLHVPHVEKNGNLCLYTNDAAFAIDSPKEAIEDALKRTVSILGSPDLQDFDEEYNSYWQNTSDGDKVLVLTSDGRVPSEYITFSNSGVTIVADEKEILKSWCINLGIWQENRIQNFSRIDLNIKLKPTEYPGNVAELLHLLRICSNEEIAKQLMQSGRESILLLRFINNSENVDVGIRIPPLNLYKRKSITNGFRIGHIPMDIIIGRSQQELKSIKIDRISIQPVHHNYIHSRGGNGIDYSLKKVVVVGGGSLGSNVAYFLSKAGVGKITIIDDEVISWDNIGRHLMGATSVGEYKAESISEVLRKQSPHLLSVAINKTIQNILINEPQPLIESDLVISCMGEWTPDYDLNAWGRNINDTPGILFGWLEEHSISGHALLVHPTLGGCLACGCNKWGEFKHKVIRDHKKMQMSPGCSGFYQPYGTIDMLPVVHLICRTALDYLSGLIRTSELRTWLAPQSDFDKLKLTVNKQWESILEKNREGYNHKQLWKISDNCAFCK